MGLPQFMPVASAVDACQVSAFLCQAESNAGLPVVDESEKLRLDALAEDRHTPDWQPYVSRSGGCVCAYAGVRRARPAGGSFVELAVNRRVIDGETIGAYLQAVAELSPGSGIWIRAVTGSERQHCVAASFDVSRELAIYRCSLRVRAEDPVPPVVPHAGIRPMKPADVEAVASILAAAYADTAEAGWTPNDVEARMSLAWFRLDDVLLATGRDGATVEGLHWMKRRDDATAEVYNLAVHPQAHGRGLGRQLLAAGKRHMATAGFTDMILWVDTSNEPAVRLYESAGFEPYASDLLLSPPSRLSRSR